MDAAAAHHQPWLQQDLFGFGSTLEALDPQPRCMGADLLARLVDARQAILVEGTIDSVVVTNDRKVFRNTESA